MKKSVLSAVLALAMLVTALFSVTAFSTSAGPDSRTAIVFTLSDKSAEVGENVEIQFDINQYSHLVNMDFVVTYDPEILEIQKAYRDRTGETYAVINTTVLPGMSATGLQAAGRFKLAYADMYSTDEAGKMFALTFKVLKAPAGGSTKVTVNADPIGANYEDNLDKNKDYTPEWSQAGGTISIAGGPSTSVTPTTTTKAPTTVTQAPTTTTKAPTTTTKAPEPSDDINLLLTENIGSKLNLDVTVNPGDGSWIVKSTAAGSLGIAGCGVYDASIYKYHQLGIVSDVPYVYAMYDGANNKWMTSGGDFFPDFNTSYDTPAPAGLYKLALYTNGCYTWAGDPLPATVEMSSIYIEPQAAGTMVIGYMAMSKDSTYHGGTPTLPTSTTTTEAPTTTTEAPTTTTEAPVPVGTIALSIADKAVKIGETFTVDVYANEVTDLAAAQFKISYDSSKLTYVSGTTEGVMADMALNAIINKSDLSEVWVTGTNASGLNKAAGKIATMTFTAAAEGTVDLTFVYGMFLHTDVTEFESELTGGEITITPKYQTGDVNRDGKIDMADALLLYQFTSGKTMIDEEQKKLGDVNNDGVTDMRDTLVLYQQVAG